MFNVTLSNEAKKNLKDLHRSTKKIAVRIDAALSDLEDDPLPFKKYDMDKVESKKDTFRIRISSYRIIYKIFWQNKMIRIIKIGIKGDETYKIR